MRGSYIAGMLSLLITLLLALPVQGAHAEKRVALVIGNSAYQNTAALSNPVNDSDDIAAALTKVGFSVLLEHDLEKRGMEDAVARFARLAQDADVALFFYAGHGMQYRGSNYLMPVDAKLEDEFKLTFELTRLDDVLFGLERARGIKVLIVDACRDNPLADRLTRTAASRDFVPVHGLAKIEANRGMVIAYSTQANQVAIDGNGRNSPFATALVKEIQEPGVEIGALFRRVAADVNAMTGGRQLPELSLSLVGDFYLNNHDTDLQAWAKLKGSTDGWRLREFVEQYHQSPLLSDVQDRLAALGRAEQARIAEQKAKEQAARAERDRLAREQAERESLAKEQVERERRGREQAALEEQAKLERDQQKQAQPAQAQQPRPPPGSAAASPQTAMRTPPAQPAQQPQQQSSVSQPLTSMALVRAIKNELKRVGCASGPVDESWDSTRSSLKKLAKYVSVAVSETPTSELLERLRGLSGRVCPIDCGVGRVERDGKCVAKTTTQREPENKGRSRSSSQPLTNSGTATQGAARDLETIIAIQNRCASELPSARRYGPGPGHARSKCVQSRGGFRAY